MLGAFFSIFCLATVIVLFFTESFAFLRTSVSTSLDFDESSDTTKVIRLNFNVTMHHLNCKFASVDVWDSLGTNRQNITANVDKWGIDRTGHRVQFAGRAGKEREIIRSEEHDESLDEILEDGSYAKPFTTDDMEHFLKETDRWMVLFYAPWCKFCAMLAPTWEKFAQVAFNEGLTEKIGIAKVDCTDDKSKALCTKHKITGFPSIFSFNKGSKEDEFHSDRTVDTLKKYAEAKIARDGEQFKADSERMKRYGKLDIHQRDQVGCMLSGYIMVNRVPGNFHIEARSKDHTIDPSMTNLSHTVNELSFGDPKYVHERRLKRMLDYELPQSIRTISPFDGKAFLLKENHQAYHHYMKVVPTEVSSGKSKLVPYQIVGQSQVVYYDVMNVPESRFSYDLSPMSVVVEKRARKWYDYLTSLGAMIGGTYTVLGLIDAALYQVILSARKHQK